MLLRRHSWDPFAELEVEMNRLMDGFLGARPIRQRRFPPINAWQDDGNLYVEAELPGLQLEDLEISVVGKELSLHGRRRESEIEGASYHLRERGADEFTRVLSLPMEVNAEKVAATLKNGVLTVTLPKAEAVRRRKIAVRAG